MSVQPAELLRQLLDLAGEAGLEVRRIPGRATAEGESPASSGICRVRDATWVVLSAQDSIDQRIDVLARALRTCAPELLDARYLAPAVRERLSPQDDSA